MKQTYTQDFELFWSKYPKKVEKKYCFQLWARLKRKQELPALDFLLKALSKQISYRHYLRTNDKFCPSWKNPATWLNRGCWDDEVLEFQVAVKKPSNGNGNGLQNMTRAFNILCNMGQDRFREFCQGVSMPEADIDAVRAKYEGTRDVNALLRGIG